MCVCVWSVCGRECVCGHVVGVCGMSVGVGCGMCVCGVSVCVEWVCVE